MKIFLKFISQPLPDRSLIHSECLEKHELTENEFQEMAEKMSAVPLDIDNRFKCYMHCMMSGYGQLNESGKIVIEKIQQQQYLPERHVEIFTECGEQNEAMEDQCEYVFTLSACAMARIRKEAEERMGK